MLIISATVTHVLEVPTNRRDNNQWSVIIIKKKVNYHYMQMIVCLLKKLKESSEKIVREFYKVVESKIDENNSVPLWR